ncbi:MAG: hypothetical protein AAGH49_00035 [Pseudomonadota bacterium]
MACWESEEIMRQGLLNPARLAALAGACALLSAPGFAQSVTVYGGGKTQTYSDRDRAEPRVISAGQLRERARDQRARRLLTERRILSVIDTRDTVEARALADALLEVYLPRDAGQNERIFTRYGVVPRQTDAFYRSFERVTQEQSTGVRIYRQSIFDDVTTERLQQITDAVTEAE